MFDHVASRYYIAFLDCQPRSAVGSRRLILYRYTKGSAWVGPGRCKERAPTG